MRGNRRTVAATLFTALAIPAWAGLIHESRPQPLRRRPLRLSPQPSRSSDPRCSFQVFANGAR